MKFGDVDLSVNDLFIVLIYRLQLLNFKLKITDTIVNNVIFKYLKIYGSVD